MMYVNLFHATTKGETQMNTKLLLDAVRSSGMTITAITERANVTRDRWYYLLSHPDKCKLSEAGGIVKALKLTDEQANSIFGL